MSLCHTPTRSVHKSGKLYPSASAKPSLPLGEAERKSLPNLCPERVGVCQRDVGNEGRGYAKTRKNGEADDQMDI